MPSQSPRKARLALSVAELEDLMKFAYLDGYADGERSRVPPHAPGDCNAPAIESLDEAGKDGLWRESVARDHLDEQLCRMGLRDMLG